MSAKAYQVCPAAPYWTGNIPLAIYSSVELVGGDVSRATLTESDILIYRDSRLSAQGRYVLIAKKNVFKSVPRPRSE
jgi:hypothetical protein